MTIPRRALLIGALASAALGAPAPAAELLMVRRAGCPWCQAWDEAVGPAYAKSELGRRIPLREVELGQEGATGAALERPVRYTPTFILVDGGREMGRIEGYPGADFFWGLLERLAQRLPPQS